ncbi:MAG: MBL fold metallo-hydrolase [Deltaproteobacteria bacterium]|nr:MBL fold metallo-hydrolase [Deltaproteobacteria bacterium]
MQNDIKRKMLKMKLTLFIGLIIMQLSLFGCSSASNASDQFQRQRITESPQWSGAHFQNPEPVPSVEWGPSLKMFWNYFINKPEGYIPGTFLPVEPFDISQWTGRQNFQFAWLGHTTVLIKIEDKVILSDPIFSQRAGSFGWLSPKRYTNTISSTDVLPAVDVVLITHNHSDHLDEASIKALSTKTKLFITPLAVGKQLEKWGVPHENILELDWWQTKSIDELIITATPAKHTSERGIFDKNKTLWVSYSIQGKGQNIYLSGDSGWFDSLYEIGERLGPFDVTFFEIGAYSKLKGQMEVHYSPEQAVKAHQAVSGKVMVPYGWGTFDLGLFPWFEPIERFLIAANQSGIDYLTPKIGELIKSGNEGGKNEWWKLFVNMSP